MGVHFYGMDILEYLNQSDLNLLVSLTILYSTVGFVSMGAFMTVIADPVIGGTYMTVRHPSFVSLFLLCAWLTLSSLSRMNEI